MNPITETIKVDTLCVFQGDVALLRAPDGVTIPEGWEEVKPEEKGICVAYGEVSGHAHAFRDYSNVKAYRNPANENQMLVLVVNNTAKMLHEEHTGYEIPAGIWWKGPQHEWSYEEEYRVVAD